MAKKVLNRRIEEYSEKQIESCGHSSPENHIFLVRRRPPGAGLFSNVMHVMQGLIRARELGLSVFVDMENYWTWYSRGYSISYSHNAWEYFFKQPKNSEPLTSQKCILSAGDRICPEHPLSSRSCSFMMDREFINKMEKVVDKIELNEFSQKLLDSVKVMLDWQPSRTIGIFYRGTEYIEKRPPGHAIQPELPQFLDIVHDRLSTCEYERIFLATEDPRLRRSLRQNYGHKFYPDFKTTKEFIRLLEDSIPGFRSQDSELVRAFGYLVQTFLFSEVKACVTTIASGSAFSFLLNQNRYENSKIVYLGTYPSTNM